MFFRLANNGRYYIGNDVPPINPELVKLIANRDYKKAIHRPEVFYEAFKSQWHHIYNKGFGFEVQALRIGGLIRRLT